MKPSTGRPSWKANTAGIDWTPIWPGICGWSSMLSLTSLTAPFAARTAFSRIGVSCRQGPHHGAQKSTSTGTSREASITSRMKSLVVVFLMRSASAAAAPPFKDRGIYAHAPCLSGAPLACRGSTAKRLKSGGFRLQRWAAAGAFGNSFLTQADQRERKHARLVAGSGDEAEEVGRREPGGRGVLERMAIDLGEIHQRLIDHDDDASAPSR